MQVELVIQFASTNRINTFLCIHLSREIDFVIAEKQDVTFTKCQVSVTEACLNRFVVMEAANSFFHPKFNQFLFRTCFSISAIIIPS